MEAPVEAGGVRWWLGEGLAREEAAPLLARALDRLEAGARELKRGRRKALYELDLAGRGRPDHLLKVNRYAGRWRRSKARRELALARALAARGVPTPVPAAAGERRRGGRLEACYLLVPLLPGVTDLRRRLAGPASPAARRALAEALGRLARALHEAGVHQDDFQPNNFLVRGGEDGSVPELWAIDFERARLGTSVPRALRHRALAKLDREVGAAPATLRMRFLIAYCGGDRAGARRCWRALAEEAPALARRDAARLLRNAARPGRRFAAVHVAGFSGIAVPGVDPGRLAAAIARARAAAAEGRRAPAGAPDADDWALPLSRPGLRHARRMLARALVLAARDLAPRPLAVLCGRELSVLVLERPARTLQGLEVRDNAAVRAARRVLARRLDGYGRRLRPLEAADVEVAPAGPGRVRMRLLSVEAFGLRPRFGGRAGSAGRSRSGR